jgi:hypothetical protein
MYERLSLGFCDCNDLCRWGVAVRSKAQVCDDLIARNAGSNPAEVKDVRLLCWFVFAESSLCD